MSEEIMLKNRGKPMFAIHFYFIIFVSVKFSNNFSKHKAMILNKQIKVAWTRCPYDQSLVSSCGGLLLGMFLQEKVSMLNAIWGTVML